MRKNVRVKTAMLMILVMAVLSACGGNNKVDTLPLPTAMAETEDVALEATAETTTAEEIVGTEKSVTEESTTETVEMTQDMAEMESETSVTETQDEMINDADGAVISDNMQPETPKESNVILASHNICQNILIYKYCNVVSI